MTGNYVFHPFDGTLRHNTHAARRLVSDRSANGNRSAVERVDRAVGRTEVERAVRAEGGVAVYDGTGR